MKKTCALLFFVYFIQTIYGQSSYKPKLLFELDFPRRFQLGLKLLSENKLAFTLKGGYQCPFLSWGSYRNGNSNITKQWSLIGPVISIGTEYNFKNPQHKISIELEYGSLEGSYSNPNYLFNGGRDYWISKSNVQSQNYTALLGYYYHFNSNYNLSGFIKIGSIYRESKEHTYFEGSREPNATNQLKIPYDKYYYETEFTARIGIQYCFGHSKLTSKKN